MKKARKKITIKQLLLNKDCWWNFFKAHESRIREDIIVAIVKVLSCRNTIRGYQIYRCTSCNQHRCVPHTCKSKACSSCGKKATVAWISKQSSSLPNLPYQHITFTMPGSLWSLFWVHRKMLNQLSAIAADCLAKCSNNEKSYLIVFTALHTFGRDLKQNVHVHLSVATKALSHDKSRLVNVYFPQSALVKMWRYRVLNLISNTINNSASPLTKAFLAAMKKLGMYKSQYINHLHNLPWIVFCQKPSRNHKRNIDYFGRYVKRPAIAESKLSHYDGSNIAFSYLDHKTKSHRLFKCTVDQFISRFIQHIPDIGFRMIRYYGALSNRLRSSLLPIIFNLINQDPPNPSKTPSFMDLCKNSFGYNPLTCTKCNTLMQLAYVCFSSTSVLTLLKNHKFLATSVI